MVKGVVTIVNENDWTDRRSGEKIKLYSFKIEGDDQWYRTGTNRPSFDKGDSISFEVGKNNNVDLDEVKLMEVAVAPAPKAGKSKAASSGGNLGKEGYWDRKDQRDIDRENRFQTVDIPRMTFCTSQDAAVKLVTAALQFDALPKVSSATKNAKLKALLAYVNEITDLFYRQRMAASTEGTAAENTNEDTDAEGPQEKSLDD